YIVKVLIDTNNIAEEVIEFDNGKDAIDYFIKNKDIEENMPDLILLDIYMPKMDGIQFMEIFSNLELKFEEKCKICVVSSSIDDNHILKTKLYNKVFKYTSKPITAEFLQTL
ncbi:MAG: response regulator, partial [Flavobacteriia bacterium]|nr:response regulator [Flavobacteriia bacterium]